MQSRLIEEITIGGEPVYLEHDDAPLDKVKFWLGNPRIRYRLELARNGKTLDQVILAMPEVTKLRKDIELNGGLRERVILQETEDGYETIEGNCRLMCYRSLEQKHPDDQRWKKIPARILPRDIDPKKVAVLLSDMHVAGKITWKAHEKAGQVYRMNRELHMPQGEIATYMRTSKTTIQRFIDAYGMMVEKFLTIDDGKYAKHGEGKWSFFDELFRSGVLRDEMKREPEFVEDFCRYVGDGRLAEGAEVRDLAKIITRPEAWASFKAGAPLSEAVKAMEAKEPEQGSDFFKLLARVREDCTSAAQVKEILRIRTDPVARKRLLDTYEALVDFMRLADVEPPAEEAEPLRRVS